MPAPPVKLLAYHRLTHASGESGGPETMILPAQTTVGAGLRTYPGSKVCSEGLAGGGAGGASMLAEALG